jgi:hypothetical protein
MNVNMNVNRLLIALLLLLAVCPTALGKDKKGQRGMLESMQSVPCGAKERGVTGVGSLFGSVGVQHVNSHEQLCPQYLLRTDEMDYHIRPLDTKHAAVLPVGREAEFKIDKDRLFLKVVDGDKKKRAYQVVSMQPVNSEGKFQSSAYHAEERPVDSRRANPGAADPNSRTDTDRDRAMNQTTDHPNQPTDHPQPVDHPPQL